MASHTIKIGNNSFNIAPTHVWNPATGSTTNRTYGILCFDTITNNSINQICSIGSSDSPLVKVVNNGVYSESGFFPNMGDGTGSVGASNNKFNTMYATTFHGDLDGTSTYVKVKDNTMSSAIYYVPFVEGSGKNQSLFRDSSFKYCPWSNELTAGQFSGRCNGPLITTSTSTNASYYISFVNNSSTGMRYSYVDANLYYNPSTNTLTTTQVNANLNGAVQTQYSATNASYYISFVNSSSAGLRYSYVNGSLYYNPSTNDLTVSSGKVNATEGFYETSDERLKDFQEDVEVNFSYLHNIPKKYYSWKDDATYTRHIGTSAQEVQKYYPELVNTDENGYLTMNYDKLSVVAIKAIDVLYEEVNELKKENAELKERLARLEELILNR